MKYNLGDIVEVEKKTINPQKTPNDHYCVYSLPGFDNGRTPERLTGSKILSNKIIIDREHYILFNKLNLKFKRVWRFKNDGGNNVCSTEFLPLYTINNDKVDLDYLYYSLINDGFYARLVGQNSGTSNSHQRIHKEDLLSMEIDLPDLEVQQKIVRILSVLDQKIELNNNESNTLQSIIDMQYRKVFSGNENNNKVKASDLFDYEGGYSYTSAELADASDIGMMTIKNFERTGGFKVDGFKALSPKKGIIKTAALYDIFISCTDVTQNADIIGNAVMLLDTDKYSTVTYSMDLVRIIPKINRFALYAILSSKDFKSFALGYKSGTTVLHLNKKCLAEYEIALPDEKSLDVFGATIEKACKKIAINLAENRCLSQIRDSLLPKLMSGTIDLDKVMTDE